jgi:serine/threonine protein kinase
MNIPADLNVAPLRSSFELPLQANMEKVTLCDAKKSRKLWWQRSVVRRSLSSIEPEFENLSNGSPFLQRHLNEKKHVRRIALFHRAEIITGEMLGKGGFSQVMDILSFNLLPEISERCTSEEQRLREYYASSARRDNGMNRYCIKHLQERLVQKPNEFKLAASDLAIEAATLSAIEHGNIVAVRGIPIDGIKAWKHGQHDGFFIVMDKLVVTLDKRLNEWRSNRAVAVTEKAKSALQLASALRYLHSKRLVYRDLKPQNIGFTADNQVKLFDFGLCRELPDGIPFEGVYCMSGVGTRRYMAPEIINDGRYNQKADVYGWAMVFWEILSLSKPYAAYSTNDHDIFVCQQGERPALQMHWPFWIHSLLKNSWEECLDIRFTIEDVCDCLEGYITAEESSKNNDLCITNHEMDESKKLAMPHSPVGVHDFPVEKASESMATNLNDESVDHMPEFIDTISPPPAPKRPTTSFVEIPNEHARSLELSLLDDHDMKMRVTRHVR